MRNNIITQTKKAPNAGHRARACAHSDFLTNMGFPVCARAKHDERVPVPVFALVIVSLCCYCAGRTRAAMRVNYVQTQ